MTIASLLSTKHIWMAKKEVEPEYEVVWDGRASLLPERPTRPVELRRASASLYDLRTTSIEPTAEERSSFGAIGTQPVPLGTAKEID